MIGRSAYKHTEEQNQTRINATEEEVEYAHEESYYLCMYIRMYICISRRQVSLWVWHWGAIVGLAMSV